MPHPVATRPRFSARRGRGDVWIWFTGSALGLCLLMIAWLIGVVLVNGLGFFWPRPLVKLALKDGSVFLGQVVDREPIPHPGTTQDKGQRTQLGLGNRDLLGFDFKWIDEDQITSREQPADVVYLERREYGPLLGTPAKLTDAGRVVAEGSEGVWAAVQPYLSQVDTDGETALFFFAGVFSHAVRKGPLLTPGMELVAGAYAPETIDPREPSAAERDAAEQVLDALAAVAPAAREDLVYARVDLVPGADGSPTLLELELTEPSMFLINDGTGGTASADRFAAAMQGVVGG